jgi:hypothetical protein
MPVIRVDPDVWEWLKRNARPLEDTPNSVLRRLAGFDSGKGKPKRDKDRKASDVSATKLKRFHKERSNSGRNLNEEWKVGARHALYHKDGNYYNHLRYFPGALFDPHGYVVFADENEYLLATELQHGKQLHVANGISSMRNYVRIR